MTTKCKKAVNIFYRIYFFAYLLILITGFGLSDSDGWMASLNIKLTGYLFCIINLVGLFSFIYEKTIFKPVFWRFFCLSC